MGTNAMGRGAADPGARAKGGMSNADRDRAAGRSVSGAGYGAEFRGFGGNPMDSRRRNLRYDQSPGVSAPLTGHNMMALANTMAPAGAVRTAAGIGPQMQGPFGPSTNFSYDSKGLGAMPGMGGPGGPFINPLIARAFPSHGAALNRMFPQPGAMPARRAPGPAAPPPSPQPTGYVPSMFLSPGGGYGVTRPGYNFFGPGSI